MTRAGDAGEIAGVPRECLMREPGERRCFDPIRIESEYLGRGDRYAGQQCAQTRKQMAVVVTATTDVYLPDFFRQEFYTLRDRGGG